MGMQDYDGILISVLAVRNNIPLILSGKFYDYIICKRNIGE